MDWLQAVFLALIQGLTEFLPVSSSAHLILPSQLFGWEDQGLAFDVAVHIGTLVAVVIYFRKDIGAVLTGMWSAAHSRTPNQDATLGLAVIVATIPAVMVGFAFKSFIEQNLRSSLVIAITTIVFGLLLWVADTRSARSRTLEKLSLSNAWIIGCAQALALIPGTSRSGITITAALMLGFDRTASARFSMLISIPLIIAAGLLAALDLARGAEPIAYDVMVIGVVFATLSAYLCIHYFMKLLEQIGMLPFVIYRMGLGIFLLFFIGLH